VPTPTSDDVSGAAVAVGLRIAIEIVTDIASDTEVTTAIVRTE
jgi:hypothetical protein